MCGMRHDKIRQDEITRHRPHLIVHVHVVSFDGVVCHVILCGVLTHLMSLNHHETTRPDETPHHTAAPVCGDQTRQYTITTHDTTWHMA